jgi:DeoR/GlpR family transcriptional regulator of sugar metabolism
MYAEERHQAIAELVASRGRVAVTELATHFDVTTETVRRDLSQLEKLKLLRRVHGGAVSMRSVTMLEAQLPDRDQAQAGEKERIARAAAALLPEGGCTLLLDAGSTTIRLAAQLPPSEHWTVITHAVPIAALLAPLPHVELHLLPGRVRPATEAAPTASRRGTASRRPTPRRPLPSGRSSRAPSAWSHSPTRPRSARSERCGSRSSRTSTCWSPTPASPRPT